MTSARTRLVIGAVCAASMIGCARSPTAPAVSHSGNGNNAGRSAPQAPSPTLTAQRRDELYDRVHRVLGHAIYFKPANASDATPALRLPPLILQEVPQDDAEAHPGARFGAVSIDADGIAQVDASRPTIYTRTSLATLQGRDYTQVSHIWWYPPSAPGDRPILQGYRATLNADGFPIIWEVLSTADPIAHIYVANSLERAARNAHGDPRPGRRYAIEADLAQHPDVVVARVLSDGPQPMGPWVYLQAPDRAVTTLICRCMASQVDNIVETVEYELVPLSTLTDGAATRSPSALAQITLDASTTGETADPAWLDRALRLPPEF